MSADRAFEQIRDAEKRRGGPPFVARASSLHPVSAADTHLRSLDRCPAVGLGEDVRIASDSIVGGGLVVDGKVVRLVAFPASTHAV